MNEAIANIIKTGITGTETAASLLGDTSEGASIIAEAWGNMKYAIAQHHGVTLDKQACIKTCEGIVRCLTACELGCTTLSFGIGILLSSLIEPAALGLNTTINALLTYRIGKLYDNLYGPEKTGTATRGFGTKAYKTILGIPSYREFQAFWRMWKS